MQKYKNKSYKTYIAKFDRNGVSNASYHPFLLGI